MLLEYSKAKSLLDRYKLNSIDSKYVNSSDDAVSFSENRIIVMKLISGRALHKSKAGLVKLGLSNRSDIKNAFDDLVKKGKTLRPYKILIQEMAAPGIEIIIGGKQDAQFGKMILLGLGGIYVEAFKDFALRVCPISRFDAEDMIAQLKSRSIVTYNGADEKMLVELLLKVSKLLVENNLKELDLNPVIIREGSYDIVDIRILK